MIKRKQIGLIINPIAGMGGAVGLKGTDGSWAIEQANKLGASQKAGIYAQRALKKIAQLSDQFTVLTCSGPMGEHLVKQLNLNYQIIYSPGDTSTTTSQDTTNAAKKLLEKNVDLLLFVGGDGTARDIYRVVEQNLLVLGIPAGVKMYSPVYATTPENAGHILRSILTDKNTQRVTREVLDINEQDYRNDILSVTLYGYMDVPVVKSLMQNKKSPSPISEEVSQRSIALEIIDQMEKDTNYILGPGTTTGAILKELGLKGTLLGIDVFKNGEIIQKDTNENDLLELTATSKSKLIITPTGGQGYLLGRGNQQLSPRVLSNIGKENIIIVATDWKLIELRGKPLQVYTGNSTVDDLLSGYYKVVTSYGKYKMYKVGNL